MEPPTRPDRPELAEELSPILVVGPMRSGTSLVARLLDVHPRMAILFESYLYPIVRPHLRLYGDLSESGNRRRLAADARTVLARRGRIPPPPVDEILEAWPGETFAGLFGAVLELHRRREGKPRAGEKTPQNHAWLGEILERFPDSRVVFAVRDPRDVVVSQTRAFGSSVAGAVAEWTAAVSSWRRFRDRVATVRYEDLTGDPGTTVRRICDYLGEPFVDEMLDFHARRPGAPEMNVPHHRRLAEPIDSASVGRWARTLPAETVAEVEAACAEGMDLLGYEARRYRAPVRARRYGRGRFLLDRLRYYGASSRRWRRGWLRWRIPVRRGPRWALRRLAARLPWISGSGPAS